MYFPSPELLSDIMAGKGSHPFKHDNKSGLPKCGIRNNNVSDNVRVFLGSDFLEKKTRAFK